MRVSQTWEGTLLSIWSPFESMQRQQLIFKALVLKMPARSLPGCFIHTSPLNPVSSADSAGAGGLLSSPAHNSVGGEGGLVSFCRHLELGLSGLVLF